MTLPALEGSIVHVAKVSFGVCLEFEALLKMLTRDIFEYTVKHEDVGQLKLWL